MTGVPSHLSTRLRDALANCEQFETNRSLRTVFSDEKLGPWRNSLPQVDTLKERVDGVISYLYDNYRRDGSNALVLLLRVLSSQMDVEDKRHSQLAVLADELEQPLGGEVSPLPRPATGKPAASKPAIQASRPVAGQRDPGSATGRDSNDEHHTTKSKDFFISYNRHDRHWAEWIAWQLEAVGYTTIVQAWDFRPGGNFVTDMQRATTEAERTIAVLSPDYLASRFTQPEWNAAFAQDPTGEEGLLLPVRVRECELKGLLPQIIYVDLVGLPEETAKTKLLTGVKRGRAKPTTEPSFPGPGKSPSSKQPTFPGITSNI